MQLDYIDTFNNFPLIAGCTYRHFKGKLYTVLQVATHTENNEELVIYYQHENQQVYARPISMFCSEVDRDKYPHVQQKYRFELVSLKELTEDDKNKFIWRTGENLEESAYIEFHTPSIVFIDEDNIEDKTEKDILYYYYGVETGIIRGLGFNEDNLGYEVISKKNFATHDFPKVHYLPGTINAIVRDDIQKETYLVSTNEHFNQANLHYQKTYEEADMFNIEYYIKIEKNVYVRKEALKESLVTTEYRLTIGSTEAIYQGEFAEELSFNSVTESELLKLKEVAEKFVQHSLDVTKQECLDNNKKDLVIE